MRPRAVVFDFNGTISNDEAILCEIFQQLFAAQGKPLAAQDYYDRLAGLSDPEIVRTWLGDDHPAVAEVVQQRIALYRAAVADGSTVPESARAAMRYAAERVPVGVVSGAAREEVDAVLGAAGVADEVSIVVTAEDVVEGKPSPESYVRALKLLDDGIRADEVVVFEDTEAGIAAAKAAGMRCVGVLGTLAEERLAGADELVPRLDTTVLERMFA
jgi:beta-phosphoglucomutase